MGQCVIIGSELYHYGVPGMKWGHRKSRVQTTTNKSPKRTESSDSLKTKASKGKKVAGIAMAAIGTATVASIGVSLFKKDKMSGYRPIDILSASIATLDTLKRYLKSFKN